MCFKLMTNNKFSVNKLFWALFLWLILPFVNVFIYSILLNQAGSVFTYFIAFVIWPISLLTFMKIVGFKQGFKELFRGSKKNYIANKYFLSFVISSLFSFLGGILTALFTSAGLLRCLSVFMILGFAWGYLINFIYVKQIFKADDF